MGHLPVMVAAFRTAEEFAVVDCTRIGTDRLKAMWDDPDTYGHLCDEIYTEMNARGEGAYVVI
jgi:hypothetical protein